MDVAKLVFEIDSTSAVTAKKNLEGMADASERVETSARKVRTASEQAGIGVTSAGRASTAAAKSLHDQAQAHGAVEKAARASLNQQGASWREFVSQRMGDYMRLEGGHGAAMKRIGAEWQAYKATATDAAQGAATAMTASQGAVEKATRDSARAAEQALALRIRLNRQRAAEEAATAKAASDAMMAADREAERSAQQAARAEAAAAKEAAAATASTERERVAAWRQSQRINAEIMRERVALARAAEREEAAAAKAAAAARAEADRMAAAATADLERRIFALKSAIDPAYAAQSRLDAEMKEAAALYRMGAISSSDYAKRVSQLDEQMAATARGQMTLNGVMVKGADHQKVLAYTGLNLSRQFADIAVTGAMGMSPLMILIQQGPQIADAFAQAKIQGLGFSAVLKGIAVSAWAAISPFAPLIAAAVAVTAVIGGGVALAARQLNKDNKDLAASLGLTAKQMEHLKDKGVDTGVTIGDVFKGTFNYLKGAVAPTLKPIMKWFDDLFDNITKGMVVTVKAIVGGFAGAFAGVKAIWSEFPAVMGDLFASGANLAISAIEKLLNFATTGINNLIEKANAVSGKVGGPQIGALGGFSLGRVDNPNAGAASKTAENAAAAVAEAYAKAGAGVDKVFAGIGAEIVKAAKARIIKAAGDADKSSKAKTASETRDMSEERSAQIAAQLEQALADELRARLSMAKEVKDRAEIERQIASATASAKQSRIDVQIASIADDKGLSDLKKAELTLELQRIKFIEGGIADVQRQAINDKERADLAAEASAKADSGAQNAIDLLESRVGLSTSLRDQLVIEKRIRALRHQALVSDQQTIIDRVKLGQGTRVEAEIAADRIKVLNEIYDNDVKIAARQNEMLNAYADAIEAIAGMARSIIDGDVGGSISGLSNTLGKLSSVTSGGLSNALGSAASFLGPVGAAVSAVTGVLGVIGEKSAAKAQAKLDALTKGVENLRTDNKTSSGSIAGALEQANKAWNSDLEYTSQMVTSLRSIDNQIGALANALSRSITAGGLLSTSTLGLGKTGGGGLFGSSSNAELLDQGLAFNPTTYGQGVTGSTYADLATTKTKKFLGITTGVKVSNSTVNGAIDPSLLGQINGIIEALGNGVLSAASVFGVEAAKAAETALGSAMVDLGKLSLKDLSADEIAAVLQATFDKVGDQLAAAGVPGLDKLATVGEGAFETLTRLAREYQVVDTALTSIGMAFKSVGLESIAARDSLVQLFGGADAFTSATSFFGQNFLTDAERLAPITKAVNDNLAQFGLSATSTRDQFKNLVLGLDVSTEAGAKAYATLLAIAPAFDKVATASEDAAQKAANAADQLTQAIAKAAEQQRQIDDYLKSKTDEALQTATASQEAYNNQLSAFADAATTASHALDDTIKSLTDFADSLKAELGIGTTGGGLSQAQRAFNSAVATGNYDAIPELGKAYADAAKSELGGTAYLQVLAQIRQASLNSATSAKSDAYQSSLNKLVMGALFQGSNTGDFSGLDEIRRLKAAGLPMAASGGSFMVDGHGGTDNNLLSINGEPQAAVNQGERVFIEPRGARGPANDNGNAELLAEVKALRRQISNLEGSSAKTAKHTERLDDNIDNVTEGGTAMRSEAVG